MACQNHMFSSHVKENFDLHVNGPTLFRTPTQVNAKGRYIVAA